MQEVVYFSQVTVEDGIPEELIKQLDKISKQFTDHSVQL